MADVYRVLGDLSDEPGSYDAADGRPATQVHAHARLARMLCADCTETTESECLALARLVAERQEELLGLALERVVGRQPAPPRTVILAGSGSFVAERAWRRLARLPCRTIDLGRVLARSYPAPPVLTPWRCWPENCGRENKTMECRLSVVKVGGSLLDMPDLPRRLREWLATQALEDVLVLVPGGGPPPTSFAAWTFAFGSARSALTGSPCALTLNAHILACLLPEARLIAQRIDAFVPGSRLCLLDSHAFAGVDEHAAAGALPHHWDATSDSLAARVAVSCAPSDLSCSSQSPFHRH